MRSRSWRAISFSHVVAAKVAVWSPSIATPANLRFLTHAKGHPVVSVLIYMHILILFHITLILTHPNPKPNPNPLTFNFRPAVGRQCGGALERRPADRRAGVPVGDAAAAVPAVHQRRHGARLVAPGGAGMDGTQSTLTFRRHVLSIHDSGNGIAAARLLAQGP